MFIEVLDGLGRPITLRASRVLIKGPQGTPIMVAAEWGSEAEVHCSHLRDPEFHQMLRNLGIKDTVVVQELRVPKSADFRV